ncbi:hypothetical protein AM404_28315 (plasmid) [Klebsiella pneumoniae]|nr:hypothetical protein AGG42_00995 [Klebsiella pneumoniae]OVW11224.1 hypothetical protein BME58_26275 [Klebsiella quasipneumoniae subsp. similipneumoniae]OYE25372.1 hypothetical protein CI676_01195 [Escherichia coli]OYG13333.1 hypothetical protein CI650_16540 [Shigella sonnei]OYI21166.1 hypothetical protein CI698_26755 [Klebsiella pneumoniae subsp. pneumoniae]PAY70203.1 hypothetical protein CEG96_18270 [Shigella flexneri]QDE41816.1 hypothetical protein E6P06_00300 [Citrobacter sp. CF971]
MGSCAAPSAKGDDKFITTDYLQQCHRKLPELRQLGVWPRARGSKAGERRIRASAAALSAETRRDGRASATRGSRQQLRGSPPTGPRRILSAAVCNRRSARRLLVRVCARRVCNRREGIDPAIQPVDSPSITHPVPSFTHPTPSITHRKPSITHRGVL